MYPCFLVEEILVLNLALGRLTIEHLHDDVHGIIGGFGTRGNRVKRNALCTPILKGKSQEGLQVT